MLSTISLPKISKSPCKVYAAKAISNSAMFSFSMNQIDLFIGSVEKSMNADCFG